MKNMVAALMFLLLGLAVANDNIMDRVAFDARMSKVPSLVKDKTMVFDKVNVDVGITGGYNFMSGEFTAPVCGLYSFSVTVAAQKNNFVSWNIVGNGKVRAKAYANAVGVDSSISTTENAVIILQKGEKVQIQHNENQGDVRCDGQTCPRFSGFLIRNLS